MSHPEIYVVTAEVRRSADQMDVVARKRHRAARPWRTAFLPRARRGSRPEPPASQSSLTSSKPRHNALRADLTDLGNKLRAAADVYEKQDSEAGGALDSSMGGAENV